MQIVIDIPDKTYENIVKNEYDYGVMNVIVQNGTQLPKGHGRLIDADILRSMYSINRANFNTVVGIQKWIDDAPTIIEADKAESEGSEIVALIKEVNMYKVKRFTKMEYLARFLNDWLGMYQLVWAYKSESEIVALIKEVEL